jgi:proteasome alpha subunit
MPLMPGEEIEANDSRSVADIQFEKMIDHTHWRLDPRLVRKLIAASLETTEWLWGLLPEKEKKRISALADNGQSTEPYPVAMTRLCRDLGVEILVNTKATRLITDKSGAVTGALAEKEGKSHRISAGAVVIATGGFIGNEALMKKYYHPYEEDLYDKINIIGQKHTGDGILMAAENPSSSLSKISEIYDCIAFAGVGKYSEFENLRKSGIRYADIKGYTYSRADVTGKSLANAYSQVIGNIFTREIKPLEVEILVVEVGDTQDSNAMFHILFDGSISDRHDYAVIGGHAEVVSMFLKQQYTANAPLHEALTLCHKALEKTTEQGSIRPDFLEVAVLDRQTAGRKFCRLSTKEIREHIGSA